MVFTFKTPPTPLPYYSCRYPYLLALAQVLNDNLLMWSSSFSSPMVISVVDPGCFYPGSKIYHPGFGSAVENFSIFNPKNLYEALGYMIQDVHPGSGLFPPWIQGSQKHRIPDPGNIGSLLKAILPLVVRKSLWRPLFQPEKPKPVYVTMFSPSASVWGSLLSSFWADEAVFVT